MPPSASSTFKNNKNIAKVIDTKLTTHSQLTLAELKNNKIIEKMVQKF